MYYFTQVLGYYLFTFCLIHKSSISSLSGIIQDFFDAPMFLMCGRTERKNRLQGPITLRLCDSYILSLTHQHCDSHPLSSLFSTQLFSIILSGWLFEYLQSESRLL
jgi:hypothetical protein